MNSSDSLQFLQPLWLWMLAPTWLLIWAYIRQVRRKAAWARYCDAHLLAYMAAGQRMNRSQALPAWILGGVLSLGIFSAAAPSWSILSDPVIQATDARIIVLDLSRSMLVQDVKPSRYAHAVVAASEILASDYAGETGLVVFAGTAFVLSPLSRDANSLLAFVEAVHPDTMPQDGSNLAQAITTAQNLLAASSGDRGQILLISSGDSHGDDALRESSAAAFAAVEQNISVSVIAIGSVAGGPMRDPKGGLTRTAEGGIKLSRPNFDLLQRIATAGEGSMMIVDGVGINADLLNSGISASALVTSQLLADRSAREASDDGAWLVWLMLPLVLLLFRRNLLFVLLLALILQSEQ
jgi:Ca-activated chloride channel family protein